MFILDSFCMLRSKIKKDVSTICSKIWMTEAVSHLQAASLHHLINSFILSWIPLSRADRLCLVMTISSPWCNQITINHLPACLLTFHQLTDLPPWHEHCVYWCRRIKTTATAGRRIRRHTWFQSVASSGESAPKFPSTALTFTATAERERDVCIIANECEGADRADREQPHLY